MQQRSFASEAIAESLASFWWDAKVIGGICLDVNLEGEVTCESLHHKDFLLVFAVNKMCLLGAFCKCYHPIITLLFIFIILHRFTKCSESH